MGGGQYFEQPNVEQPISRNSEISNIIRTKNELFDFFILKFNFYFYVCLSCSNT